jgi:hypothetical protein
MRIDQARHTGSVGEFDLLEAGAGLVRGIRVGLAVDAAAAQFLDASVLHDHRGRAQQFAGHWINHAGAMQHADFMTGGCIVRQHGGWQRQGDGSKGEHATCGHGRASDRAISHLRRACRSSSP